MMTILIIYLILGVLSVIVALIKEPIILEGGLALLFLVPIGIIIWPWVLYATFKPSSGGRWI